MVTAEAAMVLPVLVSLSVALAWLVLVGVAQVRCVDAAREAARLHARGEPTAVVDRAVASLAPGPASWEVTEQGDLLHVSVQTSVRPRLPLIGDLPALGLSSDAAAATEPDE
jgi:hypothetical protein